MIDPSLWADVPFGNLTAWQDFLGYQSLWHRALADTVFALTGVTYRTVPLGDGGGPEWLEALSSECASAAAALGIAGPPDLASYDLADQREYESFMFVNAQVHKRLREGAGIN